MEGKQGSRRSDFADLDRFVEADRPLVARAQPSDAAAGRGEERPSQSTVVAGKERRDSPATGRAAGRVEARLARRPAV